MKLRIASLAVLPFLLATSLAAEPLRITIGDAIRMAIGEGTSSELARSAEQRARIAQSEAFSALLPQVDARLQRYNQSINLATFGFSLPGQPPVVGPFNVTDAQIAAAVQLFNLAALRRYEALRVEAAASRFDTQQAENDVAGAVARLYVMVQRSEAQIASRQADVALFQRLVGVAQDELTAGTGTRLDVAQANVQLARARTGLLIAQNERESARLALLNAIGADESADLALADPLAPPSTTPDLDPALARATAQRPELRQAETRANEARLMVAAARARRMPSVALDFEGDLSGNRTDDLHSTRRIAGVVAVPIFRADLNANIARARVALRDAETNLNQRRRDVEQDVRRSLLTLANGQARVAVARENVRVAEEALEVARDRRSAGYGSPIEVDRAQDSYRQAHEDFIAAEADAVAAQFEYEHATGDIRRYVPQGGTSDGTPARTDDGTANGGSVPPTPRTTSGVSTSTPELGPAIGTPLAPVPVQQPPAIPVQPPGPAGQAPAPAPAPQPITPTAPPTPPPGAAP
jgi:outer membrane protein